LTRLLEKLTIEGRKSLNDWADKRAKCRPIKRWENGSRMAILKPAHIERELSASS
jgi:hypothetical protein